MKEQKGITMVTLVMTIVIMLILVGVTITASINGGLFQTTRKATILTEISQIKEALEEEKIQKKMQKKSIDNITIEELDITDKLKEKYKDKIIISETCEIEYDLSIVTDETEREALEEKGGICLADYYTYRNDGTEIAGLSEKGAEAIDKGKTILIIPSKNKDGITISFIGSWSLNAGNEQEYATQKGKIKKIILPDTIQSIGDAALQWLTGLEEIKIPESIEWIGYQAFYGSI